MNVKCKCKILHAMHFFPGHYHYVTDVAKSGVSEPTDAQSGPTSLQCWGNGMDTVHTEATRI